MERSGRNDPCPCGSGRKYKKCCLEHEAERASFLAVLEAQALPLLAQLARFAEKAAGAPLETLAREEFPFWHGPLTKDQGARVVDFLMFEYRPKYFARRTVEEFSAQVGPTLRDEARKTLDGWVDAQRRLYRAGEWSGGFISCVDVLAPPPATVPLDVFEIEASWRPSVGEPFALRALPVGNGFFCAGRPLGFSARSADDVAEAMRRRHLDFVRNVRIAGIDEFLRLAPKALDEESTRQAAGMATIIVPGA